MSSVKLVAFKKDVEEAAFNSIKYHMVFETSNYSGSKFIGVLVDSPIQGIGSAKYEKFIYNGDLDLVLEIVGLSRKDIHPNMNCGD